jgi:hypothetical protein
MKKFHYLLPSIFYILPARVLAHAGEEVEEHDLTQPASDVASVDPVMAGGVLVGAVIIGFLVWRFILKK